MSGKERLEPRASSKWLSKSAAAKYIHRHVDAVQELIESGEIPAEVFHDAGIRALIFRQGLSPQF